MRFMYNTRGIVCEVHVRKVQSLPVVIGCEVQLITEVLCEVKSIAEVLYPIKPILHILFPLQQLLHPPKLFPWSCHFQKNLSWASVALFLPV